MNYVVSWENKDTGLTQYKRYVRKDAALKFANKLSCNCTLRTYTDFIDCVSDYVSEVKIIKEQNDEIMTDYCPECGARMSGGD